MGMKPRVPSPEEAAMIDSIRRALGPRPDVIEKRMFGGQCFMVRGHMALGTAKGNLMVRVGPDQYGEALGRPEARPMDFTGKPLTGFVYVDASVCKNQRTLAPWVARALRFNASMPAK